MKKTLLPTCLWILSICFQLLLGQKVSVPFDSDLWTHNARAIMVDGFMGYEKAVYLQAGQMYLPEVSFLNGIIEFDMYLVERPAFPGVMFRMEDKDNYEEIYFRPHQSGMPDANQYTPVYNGNSAWQLYHDQARAALDGLVSWHTIPSGGYNSVYTYKLNAWTHVRMVISGMRVSVYLDDREEPAMQIRAMKRPLVPGGIGIKTSAGPIHFANFTYECLEDPFLPKLDQLPPEASPDLKGLITSWEIAGPVDEKSLINTMTLPPGLLTDAVWIPFLAEETGLVNLSTIAAVKPGANTLFARVIIHADKSVFKMLDFGFSDRIHIYCNGQLIFIGNAGFRSRDYRFLGTIGFFDGVVLPLRRGENEILLAVSETFGGWGLMGKIEDREGMKILPLP